MRRQGRWASRPVPLVPALWVGHDVGTTWILLLYFMHCIGVVARVERSILFWGPNSHRSLLLRDRFTNAPPRRAPRTDAEHARRQLAARAWNRRRARGGGGAHRLLRAVRGVPAGGSPAPDRRGHRYEKRQPVHREQNTGTVRSRLCARRAQHLMGPGDLRQSRRRGESACS